MAFCPRSMDRAAVDGIGFWLGSAGEVIQQIGLAVISVVFLSGAIASTATTTKRNKDLQDDKEGYATAMSSN